MCLTIYELLIKLLNFKRGLCRVEAPQHKCIIMHFPEKILNGKRAESLVYILLVKNKPSCLLYTGLLKNKSNERKTQTHASARNNNSTIRSKAVFMD